MRPLHRNRCIIFMFPPFILLTNTMKQIILSKLIVAKLDNKYWFFMESEASLLCLHQSANGPYPEPDESIYNFPSYFSNIQFNIIFKFTPRSSDWSLSVKFSNQNFNASLSYVLHAPLISFAWFLCPVVQYTSCGSPHYAVFSSLLPLPPS